MALSGTNSKGKIARLCTLMRENILSGRLKPGASLPAQRELGRRHNVSEATVAAGLGRLVQEGLVVRIHGRGSFVAEKLPAQHKVLDFVRMRSRYTVHHNSTWELAWIEELTNAAQEAGWIPQWHHIRDREAADPRQLAENFSDSKGVIIFSAAPVELPVLLYDRAVPVVTVLSSAGSPSRYCRISYDRQEGVRLATEHLLSLGHSRIGFVGLHSSPERLLSFLNVVRRHKSPLQAKWLINIEHGKDLPTDPWDSAEVELLQKVLQEPDRPQAFCCATENIAYGVLKIAGDLGLRVPQDLALIACNSGGASFGQVGITTVAISKRETCRKAVEIIERDGSTEAHGSRGTVAPIMMPLHLTVKDSCGAKLRAASQVISSQPAAQEVAVYRV